MRRPCALLAGCALSLGCSSNDAAPDGHAPGTSILGTRPECAHVVVEAAPDALWKCTAPGSCLDDYLAFPDRAAEHRAPISEAELDAKLAAIDAGEVPLVARPVAADDLSGAILDGLGVRFLVEGLAERELRVKIVSTRTTDTYDELSLLLEDPLVGEFPALLLAPLAGRPSAGVVALHGHRDNATLYRFAYDGESYPSHATAILMLTLRAMDIDADEEKVTRALLLEGFDLLGLRVYESLLGLELTRCLASVDPERVGLIGHSGGSSTGNLTVRISDAARAYVSDHQVDYHALDPGKPLHCESVPDLYPWSALVNDFSTAAVPVLGVPYGYTDGMDAIFAFFDERLR